MNRIALAALIYSLVILSAPLTASAFDIYPEYQGINEMDLARSSPLAGVDSEYQTDVNAYSTAFIWERDWAKTTRAFDLSVGSLTNQHFMLYSRAKMRADLLDDLCFDFVYFQQRDRETDQLRHIVELSQAVTPWLRVNAYGEPSLYKRENDIGFALLLYPTPKWENRFYYTKHDFTRAQHNNLPDSFIDNEPNSIGWASTYLDTSLWARGGFRYDQPVEWSRPQENRVVRYGKRLAYGDAIWNLDETRAIGARLQWDSLLKGQTTTAAPISEETWRTERHFARMSYLSGKQEDFFSYEAALMYAGRLWTRETGAIVSQTNYLPSLTGRFRGPRRADGFDHIQVGLETTVFNAYGDFSLMPSGQRTEAIEQRMQAAYEFNFKNDGKLLLAFNFDLDEWTGLPTFEGGNAQFRVNF